MKKIIAIALILCLLFAIAACRKDDEKIDASEGSAVESQVDETTGGKKTPDKSNKTLETLEGGMKVKEPQGGYGETQLPDAE